MKDPRKYNIVCLNNFYEADRKTFKRNSVEIVSAEFSGILKAGVF